jgi:hypothetical protein
MHILKFTQTTEPPETIYCYETIGWNDSGIVSEISFSVNETIGFRDVIPQGINELITETLGFGDSYILGFSVELEETIGFNDGGEETLVVYCFETIGWGDATDWELANSIIFKVKKQLVLDYQDIII